MNLHLNDEPTPACRIAFKKNYPPEFLDPNGNTIALTRYSPSFLSLEFTCTDQDGKLIGAIKPAGLLARTFTLTCGNTIISVRYSSAKSKGTKPRLLVREFRTPYNQAIDPRLLLGSVSERNLKR